MRGGAWLRVAPAILMLAYGGNHFSVLLLLYRAREGYTSVQVDLLFALYIVGIIPGLLVVGPLSDRYGRKPLLVAGVLLGCLGSSVLAAGAGSVGVLGVGRLVSGISVAIAMVVGSSWVKELSTDVPGPVAARRASLSLTAGFGLGPLVSGLLAQVAPAPTVLPYLVHVVLTLAAGAALLGAEETRAPSGVPRTSLLADLGVPRDVRRRFLWVIVPGAPWVFGCAGLAFAITPALVAEQIGASAVLYATLLAVVALGCGAAIQPFAVRIGAATGGRQLLVGMGLVLVGLLLVALESVVRLPALGVAIAAVLGLAYGLSLVSGLTEVQRMARPDDLAGITAVYYSVTYVGFTFPVVLAALTPFAPEPVLLLALAVLAAGCLGVMAARIRIS
ncbi:MAG TPA: MFS transporter [Amnibacterium sp.]|uniref:MFS transporter n=1 Tax=Amnibacterium sp. TaxID=1872496 RepID=UPI002F94D735